MTSRAGLRDSVVPGKRRGFSVFAAVLPLVSACSGGEFTPQGESPLGVLDQAIVGGADSGAAHDSVLVLTTFRAGVRTNLCTATLVAPNLILTARHCVSDTDTSTACSQEGAPLVGSRIKADRDPGSLAVFMGSGGITPDSTRYASASARGLKLVVDSSATLCNGDIAFVVLDRTLEAPVAPLRLGSSTRTESRDVGGWGIDESGTLPARRQVRADVPILGLGPAMYPNHARWGYGGREFMLGESACAGDSGSPAFSKQGAVVGVAARAGNGKARDPNNAASTCMGNESHAVYTNVAKHRDLVNRAFDAARATPRIEGSAASVSPTAEASPTAPEPARPSATTKMANEFEDTNGTDMQGPPAEAAGCSVFRTSTHDAERTAWAAFGLVGVLMLRMRRSKRATFRSLLNDAPP